MEAFYWAFDYIFCYECGKGRGTDYILLHLLIFYLSLFCLLFSHLFISDYRGIRHYYLIFVKIEQRFLDPHFIASGTVRIFSRKQTDIQRYLLNYMGRDRRYSEQMRNCQTFSADFYGFMAGKANVEPFHKVCRLSYSNRGHNFLYSPEMYGAPHK